MTTTGAAEHVAPAEAAAPAERPGLAALRAGRRVPLRRAVAGLLDPIARYYLLRRGCPT
ncbi:hypothetical protein [Micromonospora sp. NPDC023956]|uniref:hypothetical protein n=1 Tax=Micromonospora sp. NPDC023956 TaxID=3155722 RepID=UPI0033F41D9D